MLDKPDNTPKSAEPQKESPLVRKLVQTGDLSSLDDLTWLKLLQNIREKNVSIEALLRAAKPIDYDGKKLTVGVYYQFHKEHLEDVKNTRILEEICKGTLGIDNLKINFELIDKPASNTPEKIINEVQPLTGSVDKDIIDAAKEIFG